MESIERLVWEFGEAGRRLAELGALEGAAGNISTFLPGDDPQRDDALATLFPEAVAWDLPDAVTLPRGTLLITGTGRRLRDAAHTPDAVLCAVCVDAEGRTTLRRADPGVRPTSEIDSHAGIHAALASAGSQETRSIVHAQPPHLTWLSHIPAYREFDRLNRQLFRWQPETIVMLPEGIGVLPFVTPGTPEQGTLTTEAALRHRLVVWSKHGVVARAGGGPLAAADLVEYAEAAARYEVFDLQAGRPADGIALSELRAIARRFGVAEDLLDRLPEELLR